MDAIAKCKTNEWGTDSDPRVLYVSHRLYRRVVMMATSLTVRLKKEMDTTEIPETYAVIKESLSQLEETMRQLSGEMTTKKTVVRFQFGIGQLVVIRKSSNDPIVGMDFNIQELHGVITAQIRTEEGELYMTDVTDVEMISSYHISAEVHVPSEFEIPTPSGILAEGVSP